MTAAAGTLLPPRAEARVIAARALRRNAWAIGLLILFAVLFAYTRLLRPNYGAVQFENLAIGALPVALAAIAQAIAVISGGIDLSVASVLALTNVTAARLMDGSSEEFAVVVVVFVLFLGVLIGLVNGALVVFTRVPDIVVTLAMSFVWAGAALLVMGTPSGAAAAWLKDSVDGTLLSDWVPRSLVILLAIVAIVWIPLRRTRLGLSIYAVGSNQLAAFRSGVDVGRTKIVAYGLTGLFASAGGLALTAQIGQGQPIPGPYTLLSVAAVVLGGVSLAGGRGGLAGPIIAVFVLALIRTDLTFLGVDPNLTTVIQGAIMVIVVMVGALLTLRRQERV